MQSINFKFQGFMSAIISGACVFILANIVLKFNLIIAIVLAIICGAILGYNTFYTMYVSETIKEIVQKKVLTSEQLAAMMNDDPKKYPVIRGELRLIISRSQKKQLLNKLLKMS